MDASKSSGKRHEVCFPTPLSGKEPREVSAKRMKVNRALMTFRNLFHKLVHQFKVNEPENSDLNRKAMVEAAVIMKTKNQWENTQRCVGGILGIEIGDVFQHWVELNIVGLHRIFWTRIDYKIMSKRPLATSIVVADGYDNNGSLVYVLHGRNPTARRNPVRGQITGKGNLALQNSMQAKSPVRVILRVDGNSDGAVVSSNSCSFVYDGLYLVDSVTIERGRDGRLVYKFSLSRILGQPPTFLALKDHGESSKQHARLTPRKRRKPRACAVRKEIVRVNDLSNGEEKFTVRVVTSNDCDQLPTSFEYILNNIYSKKFEQATLCACDCSDGCVNKETCVCFMKNGVKMQNDSKKRVVSPKESSLIYECGPSCKCSSSCINRVSQHGIRFQLEIFLTELKGWGVRTRSFIPSGSFVCEYIGEVTHHKEAAWKLDNEYIFHMGMFMMKLPFLVFWTEQLQYSFAGVGKFSINASKRGNVGRFINHSCSPNLLVKDVMYDHNDKNLPHKMLFAARDIPPGRELSYDYNSFNGKFIKFKFNTCYCGSPACNGKIYI
ncbi:unnamed protein product [Sphenostylis stenocarpa]|uniref:Uncharacterized protein n=1 Tax=Sphenostylis stenocarpa TaxID=92480 RepID=A0AA86SVD9_9FABA|nr:unnamed protein product [Sphenostylis stenocarpa]